MKCMTDDQLVEALKRLVEVDDKFYSVYSNMLRQHPINSKEFRLVCRAGKALVELRRGFTSDLENRHDSTTRVRELVGDRVYNFRDYY